jgi:hypothetical protein
MAFNFPSPAVLDQVYTDPTTGKSYTYNGQGWTYGGDPGAADHVLRAGDTMTGGLAIDNAYPGLSLNVNAAPGYPYIWGKANGLMQWEERLGGTGSSGDFSLSRFDDAGTLLDTPLTIYRATGITELKGDLTIALNDPTLWLNRIGTLAGTSCTVAGKQDGSSRWHMALGDGSPENNTYPDEGSNFTLTSFSDAGASTGSPLTIYRSGGQAHFTGTGGVYIDGGPLNVRGRYASFTDCTLATSNSGDSGCAIGIDATSPTVEAGASVNLFRRGGQRWAIGFDRSPDTGFNTGSNFFIGKYNNDGTAPPGPVLAIMRDTNKLTHNGVITARNASAGGGESPIGATLKLNYLGGPNEYGIVLSPDVDNTVPIYFVNASAVSVGNISITTVGTAYNVASAAELKEDLKSFDAGNIIDKTEVYDFRWKATGERSFGVIAQQANEVYPQAVTHFPVQLTKDEFWGVDYSKYVPVLLQEVKALRQRVVEQAADIAALKAFVQMPTIKPR